MKHCTNKSCQQSNPQPLDSFRVDNKTKKPKARCIPCSIQSVKTWRTTNPAKFKGTNLKRYWPELSGQQSLDEYNKLLEEQDHKCKLCLTAEKDLKFGLCVDHCHTTGKIRGLLCDNCNQALGLLKDSTPTLLRAVEYLK